jgi:hypothetical protein
MKPNETRGERASYPQDRAEVRTRRGPRPWQLALAAGLLGLLELAFLAWLILNFGYLQGCWKVMREMELGALDVAPWQSLSIMIPIWIGLGIVAYNYAIALILRIFRMEEGHRQGPRSQAAED